MKADVHLRLWKDTDLAPFAAMNADAEVMRYFPHPLTFEESREMLGRLRDGLERRGWGLWAVEVDGEFGGFTGLAEPRFQSAFTPCVEIGWRFLQKHWGHGIAFAAARQAETLAFGSLGLKELVSFTTETNLRSRRLMERLDFSHNPKEDFLHPLLPAGHPLHRHVLYRKQQPL